MQKLLISVLFIASLLLGACSSRVPLPNLVYQIDIQQGNVITQDMVNQLKPGMEKSQVRFIMGTPILNDTFHQGRWDYIYTFRPGGAENFEKKRVALFFENGRLHHLEGDLRPLDAQENEQARVLEQEAIAVPAGQRREPGILMRFWERITRDDEDE